MPGAIIKQASKHPMAALSAEAGEISAVFGSSGDDDSPPDRSWIAEYEVQTRSQLSLSGRVHRRIRSAAPRISHRLLTFSEHKQSTVLSQADLSRGSALSQLSGPALLSAVGTWDAATSSASNLQHAGLPWSSRFSFSKENGGLPRRPHSSYTRSTVSGLSSRTFGLRRKSLSMPANLDTEPNQQTHLVIQAIGIPSDAVSGLRRKARPQSAMPSLGVTRESHQQAHLPTHWSSPGLSRGNRRAQSASQQTTRPGSAIPPRVWPGLLEDVDEEEQLQREVDEEEDEWLELTDPVEAQQRRLHRLLQIKQLEVKSPESDLQDWISGGVAIPKFHCPKCRDHWLQFGRQPDSCAKVKKYKVPDFVKINLPKKQTRGLQKDVHHLDDGSPAPPTNSSASLHSDGLGDGAGDGGTLLRSGLSTIPGSLPNTLLEDEEEDGSGLAKQPVLTDTVDQDKASADSNERLRSKGSFIGADGKLYTPAKVDGDFTLQEIPPPASSGSKKKGSKRRASSAKPRKTSRDHSTKPKPIKTGLGTESRPSNVKEASESQVSTLGSQDGNDYEDDEFGQWDGSSKNLSGRDQGWGHPKSRVVGEQPDSTSQRPASAAALGHGRKKHGQRELTLENIQDMFTRAWTFSYHNPSKMHIDDNKKIMKKAKAL